MPTQSDIVTQKWKGYVEAARQLLEPTPVRLHHVPNWFRLALLRTYGCEQYYTSAHAVLRHAELAFGGWRWLDHWGSTDYHGRPAFAAEPYGIGPEDMESLVALCEQAGLEFKLSPNSWWYPGHTLRILIFEPKAH